MTGNDGGASNRATRTSRSARWMLVTCMALGAASGAGTIRPSDALAQPNKIEEAKQRFLKGVDLFGEGDFQGSLVEFKRSYELNPNYTVLYNIGQVYFQMQDYANALRTLQQYLDLGGNRIPSSRRADVDKDIEKLKGRVATVTIKVSVPGAEVMVDDAPVGLSPLKDSLIVSSGKRRFTATKEGWNPARDTKEIVSGEATEVTLTLTELQPGQKPVPLPPGPGLQPGVGPGVPVPPGEPQTKHNSMVGPIVGWSVTGAMAVGWVTSGVLALGASSNLKQLKTTETTPAVLASAASKSKNLGIASDVFMGLTIEGAGVSTVLTVLAFTGEKSAAPNPVEPTAAPPHARVDFDIGPGSARLFGTF